MTLHLSWRIVEIHPKFAFKIARSTRTSYRVVIVKLSDGNHTGIGEAAPNPRYEGGPEDVIARIHNNEKAILELPINDYCERQERLEKLFPDSYSTQAALDVAFWDLYGKQNDIPLHQEFGGSIMPISSYTIGISDEELIKIKIDEAKDYPILKIKLGSPDDIKMMNTIRKYTDKKLYVDANEGWKTLDLAKERVEWLSSQGVEFIEQPMPSNMLEMTAKLREFSPLPIVADENSVRPEDVPKLKDVFDGINIKLMKCGGLTNARKMIRTARELDLKVMLGCMVETSVGISAMSQLGKLADWLDLDGNVLLADDPFQGVKNEKGNIILMNKPGIGVIH